MSNKEIELKKGTLVLMSGKLYENLFGFNKPRYWLCLEVSKDKKKGIFSKICSSNLIYLTESLKKNRNELKRLEEKDHLQKNQNLIKDIIKEIDYLSEEISEKIRKVKMRVNQRLFFKIEGKILSHFNNHNYKMDKLSSKRFRFSKYSHLSIFPSDFLIIKDFDYEKTIKNESVECDILWKEFINSAIKKMPKLSMKKFEELKKELND